MPAEAAACNDERMRDRSKSGRARDIRASLGIVELDARGVTAPSGKISRHFEVGNSRRMEQRDAISGQRTDARKAGTQSRRLEVCSVNSWDRVKTTYDSRHPLLAHRTGDLTPVVSQAQQSAGASGTA